MFSRCRQTIENVIKRCKERGSLENITRVGRPKLLTVREERQILKENRENPHLSAPKINDKVKTTLHIQVSDETVRRVLRSNNIHGRAARKKPLISKVNKEKRLLFVKHIKQKVLSFGKPLSLVMKANTIFLDRTDVVWYGGSQIKSCESKILNPLLSTVGVPGVGKLVFRDGTMDNHLYLSILKDNLHSSAEKMGMSTNEFLFQHDNDPKHTAHDVKMWILFNTKHLPTPPQSPDINPIENLWAYLEDRVREHKISSKGDLKPVLLEEWEKIPTEFCRRLIESMPRRLEAVSKNNGYHTKY